MDRQEKLLKMKTAEEIVEFFMAEPLSVHERLGRAEKALEYMQMRKDLDVKIFADVCQGSDRTITAMAGC